MKPGGEQKNMDKRSKSGFCRRRGSRGTARVMNAAGQMRGTKSERSVCASPVLATEPKVKGKLTLCLQPFK